MATAIGQNQVTATGMLKAEYKEGMSTQDALKLAVKVLRKALDTARPTADRLDVAVLRTREDAARDDGLVGGLSSFVPEGGKGKSGAAAGGAGKGEGEGAGAAAMVDADEGEGAEKEGAGSRAAVAADEVIGVSSAPREVMQRVLSEAEVAHLLDLVAAEEEGEDKSKSKASKGDM